MRSKAAAGSLFLTEDSDSVWAAPLPSQGAGTQPGFSPHYYAEGHWPGPASHWSKFEAKLGPRPKTRGSCDGLLGLVYWPCSIFSANFRK
ncbi:hypothetical protein PF010_g15 [Phytophthora fragariae]|uniref:Uncharacterized protein n=1 Tax=Phytophthora fragariae TaxID=53985 RepID=A0A6G0M525_9STRA|nr:hypothetical protein PF010_g15 [Phytophthora fragariae]KAE9256585.1 hypothetical protein PF004_g15 [Phytophthora fragariae]